MVLGLIPAIIQIKSTQGLVQIIIFYYTNSKQYNSTRSVFVVVRLYIILILPYRISIKNEYHSITSIFYLLFFRLEFHWYIISYRRNSRPPSEEPGAEFIAGCTKSEEGVTPGGIYSTSSCYLVSNYHRYHLLNSSHTHARARGS